nr:CBS domain-containing protein [Streptomyces atratus]
MHAPHFRGEPELQPHPRRAVLSVRQRPAQDPRLLADHDISGLPVVDEDEKVIGVISETDLMARQAETPDPYEPKNRIRFAAPTRSARRQGVRATARTAGQLMTEPPVTVHAEDTVVEAARTTVHRRIERLPHRWLTALVDALRAASTPASAAADDRDPRELDTAAAQDLLRQVAGFGQPAPLFVITGGDPFQRPDLTDLIAHGRKVGVRVAVSPSGTPTLTDERLRAVHAAGASGLSLRLDGSTAELHDAFRGVPGVFRWTLDAWDTARCLGMKVQINTTVARHNLYDLPDIVRLVAEHGAMLWSAFFLVPTGRGRTLGALTPAEVEDVLNFVHDVGLAVPAKTTEAHHFRRVALQRQVLANSGDDHVAVLGLGPLYRELRKRSAELGLDAGTRRVRRPPPDARRGRPRHRPRQGPL